MKNIIDTLDISEAEEIAKNLHLEGYHCTETIIRTLWKQIFPQVEISSDMLRMTEVLHGGMAETMSSHCGGLTMGILLIGIIYGREDLDGNDHQASAISRGYWRRFLTEFGTSHCTTLRSDQILTGEAPTRCGCIIVRSVKLLLNYLQEINADKYSFQEMVLWNVDRSNEPCHEKIIPVKSSKRLLAEKMAKEKIFTGEFSYIEINQRQ